MTTPVTPARVRPPIVAIVDYTLRTCFNGKRWIGVLLPCAAAVLFGLLVRAESSWEVISPPALTCDGEPRTVPLDEPLERINAVRFNGQIQDGAGAVIAAALTGVSQ